jgi:hypothetical protein
MIKIIRFEDSIYYANVENFSNSVLNTLEINYEQVLEQLNDLKKTVDKQGNTVCIVCYINVLEVNLIIELYSIKDGCKQLGKGCRSKERA